MITERTRPDAFASAYETMALFGLGYAGLFIMPCLLALPLVLPFARACRNPVRFLVLRPFNDEHITRDLSRFLLEGFAPFGHCYTLSAGQFA